MQNLTDDEVKTFYSAADHYSNDHARRDRNQAEFEAWLESHDAATRVALLENLMGILGPIEKQVSMGAANPIFNALDEYVQQYRDLAAEIGVEVKTGRSR